MRDELCWCNQQKLVRIYKYTIAIRIVENLLEMYKYIGEYFKLLSRVNLFSL